MKATDNILDRSGCWISPGSQALVRHGGLGSGSGRCGQSGALEQASRQKERDHRDAEAQVGQGELRQQRHRALAAPAQITAHADRIVESGELKQRLWSADTFVEFDKGVYNAINRLRETLGGGAETPRYIETIPKRGYRFLAEVHEIGSKAEAQGAEQRTNAALVET